MFLSWQIHNKFFCIDIAANPVRASERLRLLVTYVGPVVIIHARVLVLGGALVYFVPATAPVAILCGLIGMLWFHYTGTVVIF